MTASRPDNEAIFHAARDIPDRDHRREYIREACGGDEIRIGYVEALLAAADAPDSLLDRPARSNPVATSDHSITESASTVIGPYKLLEQIGEGGMGTVWMAQQTQPVKRPVAVKLIKAGMDSRQVIARFEAERQALALMDHPNIARVLDAGTSGAGRPYFVMDLVKGVPITRYCDEHRLTTRQRLELFIPVCRAVQHAHTKGIIHRDIKPNNVLIALYDGRPVPKVIDFGVAKAAGQQLTDKTLVTGFGAIIGTLEYMSPEQAEINQLDIDTRSDIYSLGALLYELLTGSPPLGRKELAQAGLLETLRVIREQEPTKPSTKLRTADGLPTLAANRGTEPAKLTNLVRGELDWIVMKALEKDRNRRYETANGFAMDLQRYLADEPVLACPPSAGYRLRKFVRRYRGPVLAAGLVLVALVAGIIGTSIGLVQAHAAAIAEGEARNGEAGQRRRAEANLGKARQAVNEYFTLVSDDPLLKRPDLQPVRVQLLRAALRYYEDFVREHADDPELQGELAAAHLRIGNLVWALDYDPDWFTRCQKAVAIMEDLLPKKPDAAALQSLLAGILRPAGAWLPMHGHPPDEMRRTFEKMCALWEELARAHPTAAGLRNDLAYFYHILGMGHAYLFGQHAEAVRCYQRGCDLREQLIATYPKESRYPASQVMLLYNWGESQEALGQQPKARATERRALEIIRQLAADFPEDASYQEHLVWLCAAYGSKWEEHGLFAEAEDAVRQALATNEKLARDFPAVARFQHNAFAQQAFLGNLLWRSGRRAEAVQAYRQAVTLAEKLNLEDPVSQDRLAEFLANCLDPQFRDTRRAVELAKRVVKRQPQVPGFWATLGLAHYRAKDWPAAVEALEQAVKIAPYNNGSEHLILAMAYWQRGKKTQARQWYARAVMLMEKNAARGHGRSWFRAEAEALLKNSPGNPE
jgi:serine/threonine protein kinase/tetratricopeptide (TPR) repeat protein